MKNNEKESLPVNKKEEKITSGKSFKITSGEKKMKNNHFWTTKQGKNHREKVIKSLPVKKQCKRITSGQQKKEKKSLPMTKT